MTISLALSIWSIPLTPDAITDHLGCAPDSIAVRGLDRVPARNAPEANGWHLVAESERDENAEELVAKLLGRLDRLQVTALRDADPNLDIRLVVYFDRNRPDFSLELSPAMIADLAAIKARLFIDRVDLSAGHA